MLKQSELLLEIAEFNARIFIDNENVKLNFIIKEKQKKSAVTEKGGMIKNNNNNDEHGKPRCKNKNSYFFF